MFWVERLGGSVFRAESVKIFILRELRRLVSPSQERTRKIVDTGRVRTRRLNALIQWNHKIMKLVTFRVAFKFGRCVLRRKMLKSPIARLPAILLDYMNHPSRGAD